MKRERDWEGERTSGRERDELKAKHLCFCLFFVFFFLFIVLLSKHDNFLAINRVVFALIGHTHTKQKQSEI